MTEAKTPINSYHIAWSIMIHMLAQGPCSRKSLAEATGVKPDTMGHMLRALRRPASRSIYISGWEQDFCGRWNAKLYRLGAEPDVPKPPPEQRASESWRAKQKAWRLKRKLEAEALAKEVADRAAKVDDPAYIKRVQKARANLRGEA